jgi:GT2 family glycosyltransferase
MNSAEFAPIDVVIVNWNSGPDLSRCLNSLAVAADACLIRQVVVVDNGSSDDSLHQPRRALPVTIDHAHSNLGFARACNRGAAAGAAPLLLFLNPDTEIAPGALGAALTAFERKTREGPIGIVGVRLVDESGRIVRSCSRFPTPLAFLARAGAIDRLASGRRLGAFMTDWPHDRSRVVDQVMGAFLMIRRSLFERLGGFDERFPLYYEDLDLALRVRRAGFVSWFEASAEVKHRGGGSSRRIPAQRLGLSLLGRWRYAKKHFGRFGRGIVLFAMLGIEPWARLLDAALVGSWRAWREVVIGYGIFVRNLIADAPDTTLQKLTYKLPTISSCPRKRTQSQP